MNDEKVGNGIEHNRKQLPNGNDIVLVEVSSGRSGKFYSPGYLRVAEIEHDTPYTRINAKNVVRDIAALEFNQCGSRGENSKYKRQLEKAEARFDNEMEQAKAAHEKPAGGFSFEKSGDAHER